MKGDTEKPMLPVAGKPMIARMLDALVESERFDRIVAAVSPKTPQTARYLTSRGTEVVQTPGNGYSSDLSVALNVLRPAKVLVIPADLPLFTSQSVEEILSTLQRKPLLSVVLKTEFVRKLGIIPSVTFMENGTEYCHTGVSVLDTARISADALLQEEEFLVVEKMELAVNVNTKEELRLAEKLLIERA